MTNPAPPVDDARVKEVVAILNLYGRNRILHHVEKSPKAKPFAGEMSLEAEAKEIIALLSAPSPTADEARTVWFIVRDPGCSPQRKGPFTQQQVKPFLLELMEARPTAFIEIVTIHDSEIDVQDGPEALEQIDGRYASRARNNREQRRNALSRIPSEEATEELLSEETVQACVVELFDLKSNVVRVDGPKKGSVTTETLVRTCLNAAAKRITRAPGAGT